MILELPDVLWRSVMFYFKMSPLIILEFYSEKNVGREAEICYLFRNRSVPGLDGSLEFLQQTLLGLTNSRSMSAYNFSGKFFSSNMRGSKKTTIS